MTAAVTPRAAPAHDIRGRASWVHGPAADVGLALAWVPFVVVAHVLEGRGGRAVAVLVGAVLLFSFTHQVPTIALVWGDPDQYRLHRRLFTLSPVVLAAAAAVALRLSPAAVAVVAGLWNAEHTLMQRYGITRIYGRKAGDDHGRVEKLMLSSWLVAVLLWASIDRRIPRLLARVDIGAVNAQAVQVLGTVRPVAAVLLVPAAAVAVGSAVVWAGRERSRGQAANPAKHLYVAATAALFLTILVDPLAGFVGYVGAHAVEYFAIVNQTLGRRYGPGRTGGGLVGWAVRAPGGRVSVWAGYAVVLVVLLGALRWCPWWLVASVAYLTVGGMHVLWDGVIWKLRRPAVAEGLAVT